MKRLDQTCNMEHEHPISLALGSVRIVAMALLRIAMADPEDVAFQLAAIKLPVDKYVSAVQRAQALKRKHCMSTQK